MAKYDETSIQRFAGLKGIRKKPTPYIGPTDSDGLWTCFREPADNAVDQALAGRNKLVHLVFDEKPNRYWVIDGGEGIPVGKKEFEDERGKKEKLSTLYVVTGLTHGGSNFDSDTISRGCFTGDTEVRLLNGKTVTFEQLYSRWCRDDTPIDILSYNLHTRKLQPSKISMVMIAKYTKEIAHVHLSNGSVVKCTYDHPFYVRKAGKIKKIAAEHLRPGMSLVSTYYDETSDGYLRQSENGKWKQVHRIVGDSIYERRVGSEEYHHTNHCKKDNRPINIECITKADHQRGHRQGRSIFGREKIMNLQADLRSQNSQRFAEQNADEEFIDNCRAAKTVRVAARALRKGLTPNRAGYEAARRGNEPAYRKALLIHGSKFALWFHAKDLLDYLESRVGISSRAEDRLADMDATGESPSEHGKKRAWQGQLALWTKALNSCTDPEDATPQEFNRRSGTAVLGRFASLRKYTSLSNLKAHVLDGKELVLFPDQSEEAQLRRAYRAEARMRTLDACQNIVRLFALGMNKYGTDEETYTTNKSASTPHWKLGVACAERIYGDIDLKELTKTYNYQVAHVELRKQNNEVPVYDLTVDDTHTFFVNPGVLVSNTHGIGIKATNAMSKKFTVWTCWKGDWWCIEYVDAALHKEPYKSKAPKLPHGLKTKRGTVVMFEPDLSLFHSGTKMQLSAAQEWAKLTSYLVKGMTVKLTNSNGKTKEFVSEGPATYITDKIEELKATQTGKTFLFSSKELDVALAFADVEGSHVAAYTNGLRNAEGGEHVNACIDALVKSLKPLLGKKDKFTPSDVRDGLLGLVNYKIAAPKFSSQTKERLIDERVYSVAQPQLLAAWSEFWAKNKSMAKNIIARATLLRSKTNDFLKDKKMVKNIKSARKGLASKLSGVVGKAPVSEREIFIVEGDSAGGGAVRARDRSFQAVYPLKGKPLNAMEASKDKIQNNDEILGLLAAIGAEVGKKGNLELQYGKIITLADPDVDGPLVGETRVMLCDGSTPTIRSLARKWEKNPEPFWVWSTNTEGKLVPALAQMPTQVAIKTKLVEILFDDGTTIRCSLNHKWPVNHSTVKPSHFRFDVPYLRADELTAGDSVRSIYFEESTPRSENKKVYLTWIDPTTGKKQLVHQRVKQVMEPAKFNRYKKANQGVTGGAVHIHHVNEDSFDNRPGNLKFLLRNTHYALHGKHMSSEYNGSAKHLNDLKKWWDANPQERKAKAKIITAYNQSPEKRIKTQRQNRDEDQIFRQTIGKLARFYLRVQLHEPVTQESWDKYRPQALPGFFMPVSSMAKSGITFKMLKRYIRRKGLTEADAKPVILQEDRKKVEYPSQCLSKFLSFAKRVKDRYGHVSEQRYSKVRTRLIDKRKIARGTPTWARGMSDFGRSESKLNQALETYNHKVVRVKIVNVDPTPVYCMAVPEYGNFLLADSNGNGIATGNSHINTILLGNLYKFCPQAIEGGHVYAVRSPLYKGRHKGQVHFGMTKDEVWKKAGTKCDTTYLKGWGELSPEDMYIALDPKHRTLYRIVAASRGDSVEFEALLGKNGDYRKKLLGVE